VVRAQGDRSTGNLPLVSGDEPIELLEELGSGALGDELVVDAGAQGELADGRHLELRFEGRLARRPR
jgi:hypothetical protein